MSIHPQFCATRVRLDPRMVNSQCIPPNPHCMHPQTKQPTINLKLKWSAFLLHLPGLVTLCLHCCWCGHTSCPANFSLPWKTLWPPSKLLSQGHWATLVAMNTWVHSCTSLCSCLFPVRLCFKMRLHDWLFVLLPCRLHQFPSHPDQNSLPLSYDWLHPRGTLKIQLLCCGLSECNWESKARFLKKKMRVRLWPQSLVYHDFRVFFN